MALEYSKDVSEGRIAKSILGSILSSRSKISILVHPGLYEEILTKAMLADALCDGEADGLSIATSWSLRLAPAKR